MVFDPTTDTLQHVGQASGPGLAYNQSALNFEPRVGLAWDPFKNGRTVVRSAYAIMTDQPTLGLVTGLASNPPNAFPISFAPSAADSLRDPGQRLSRRQRQRLAGLGRAQLPGRVRLGVESQRGTGAGQ